MHKKYISLFSLLYTSFCSERVSRCLKLLPFIFFFLLASCSDKKCIDADDFGFPTATVKAGFEAAELEGPEVMQVAPWTDSGYVLNGDPITIMVKNWVPGLDYNNDGEVSAWCPWYAQGAPPGMLSDLCERLHDCAFEGGIMTSEGPDLPARGAPCLLSKGKGLYALLTKPGYNPNKSEGSKKLPKGINYHLGENTQNAETSYTMYDIDRLGNSRVAGGSVFVHKNIEDARRYTGGGLYFKILDKYYEDNSGQYRVYIKSGVDLGSGDPITFLTNKVREKLYGSPDKVSYGIVENLYRKIIENSGFKTIVRAMITLYVVITALGFLAGTIEMNHKAFIGRIIKLAVVSVLLTSDYSWTFFKDYLFVYFIDGVQFVIYTIQKAGAGGPGSINILGLMMAQETFTKLFSLLFVDWRGFIYIFLYLILLFFMIKVVFYATVVYLIALVSISMIIIMGPFFICMLLFEFTRPFFDNWLKELIKYSLIPIILFTGISFMGSIIRHEVYASLGFKVCKRDLFTMPNLKLFTESEGKYEVENSLIYWWYPSKFTDDKNSDAATEEILSVIPVPEAYLDDESGQYCKAYQCFKERYVDFPFLDLEKDAERLASFRSNSFVDMTSILILFVMVILLDRFNKSAEMIAQMLANATNSSAQVSPAAKGASGGIPAGVQKLASPTLSKVGSALKAGIKASMSSSGGGGRAGTQNTLSGDSITQGGAKGKSSGDAISSKKTPPPASPRGSQSSGTPPPVPPKSKTSGASSSSPQSSAALKRGASSGTPKPSTSSSRDKPSGTSKPSAGSSRSKPSGTPPPVPPRRNRSGSGTPSDKTRDRGKTTSPTTDDDST